MAIRSLSASLPFSGLASGANVYAGLGGNPKDSLSQLGAIYGQQYNAALDMNKALFDASQSGYENLRGQLDQQYQGIQGGYNQLGQDVQGMISGSNASNITDINANYSAQAGKASQDMVSRGLGNSTVQQNIQRAIALDRARAITQSQNQFAQLGASYASQIGQGGLNAQMQGANVQANLGSQQMNALNQVNAPYPNASVYGSLAAMYGAQAQRDEAMKQNRGGFGQYQGAGGSYSRAPSPFGQSVPMTAPSGLGQFTTSIGMGGGGGYAPSTPYQSSTLSFDQYGGQYPQYMDQNGLAQTMDPSQVVYPDQGYVNDYQDGGNYDFGNVSQYVDQNGLAQTFDSAQFIDPSMGYGYDFSGGDY
jgi:hypothetical protein